MRKIILIAVLIFTATFFSIASAAEDFKSVNWDNAPTISNREQFLSYVRECENRCQSKIPVIFANGFYVNVDECMNMLQTTSVNMEYSQDAAKHISRALYTIKIYPGAKVAYAYSSGNTSILNAEEKKLYDVAVKIVNEANEQPNKLLKEYYIHETITGRVSYYTTSINDPMPRYATAIGALLDGRANCSGYTDAFYMLGKMSGLNVGKMKGNANGGGHSWNTINFGDERTYAVDVTWDDPSYGKSDGYNNYIYFNAPLEILRSTHTWTASYNPAIYPKVDERYFYCSKAFLDSNGKTRAFRSGSAETALYYIAQRISKEGYKVTWAMAPYDSKYANLNFSLNRLVREILPKQYNWYGSVGMSVVKRGNWIFYTVDAKKKN